MPDAFSMLLRKPGKNKTEYRLFAEILTLNGACH